MTDTAQTRVLDWRPRFDRRSLNYRIRDLFHTGVTPRQRTWNKTVVLDQGREGACTGFGAADAGLGLHGYGGTSDNGAVDPT